MKKYLLLSLFSIAILQTVPSALAANTPSDRRLGLGIILGEPTGFTGKYWMKSDEATDFGLTYSFNSFLLIYGDYLWHFHNAFANTDLEGASLSPYVGGGLTLFVSTDDNRKDGKLFTDDSTSDVGLGIRVPLGIEWRPVRPPIGVFAEIVPGMGFIPDIFLFFQGGVGIRYFF